MRRGLTKYVAGGHRRVSGWLQDIAIDLTCGIALSQSENGVRGACCEIGVHHGRYFILLHLLTDAGERSVAWDLFDRQSENVDRSGGGDEQIFRANLAAHACIVDDISIHTVNSLELTSESIVHMCGGRPRLFSVDGGHTEQLTAHDLNIAQGSLCDGGVVILDDFFNESWPGVAEGATRYLVGTKSGLVPFAIGGNKVLLTTDTEFAAMYRRSLAERLYYRPMMKTAPFLGYDVLIVPTLPPTLRRLFAAKLRGALAVRYMPLLSEKPSTV